MENQSSLPPQPRWNPIVRAVVFLLVYLVVSSVIEFGIAFAIASVKHLTLHEYQQWMVSQYFLQILTISKIIEMGILFLFVYLFGRALDRRKISDYGFHWQPGELLRGAGYGILFMTVAYAVYLSFGLAKITGWGWQSMSGGMLGYKLFLGVVLFVFAAIHEELLARGYILRNFMDALPNWAGLLLMGLIFGGMHLLNPNFEILGFINITLAGILFGVYYIHRKNLWFPIGLHFTWNFFQGFVYGFPVSGQRVASIVQNKVSGPDVLTGGQFGVEGSLIGTVILIGAIIGFQLYYSKHPGLPQRREASLEQ